MVEIKGCVVVESSVELFVRLFVVEVDCAFLLVFG